MPSFYEIDQKDNLNYAKSLKVIASLSNLFSDNTTPYLHYRIMEKLFCGCFNAKDLSRSDTAYDAKIGSMGIGLKTFICKDGGSIEKVAEFNKVSSRLKTISKDYELAYALANLRNDRIELANTTYGISKGLYHIIARNNNKLVFFETDYEKIDIKNIKNIVNTDRSLKFDDGKNEYFFNHSKSVLQRKFYIPKTHAKIDIEILDDPFGLLLSLEDKLSCLNLASNKTAGVDYVILPLFSLKGKKHVPQKSGLNQWNAGGRKRDLSEIYIPIPSQIHRLYPKFFPPRDTQFVLKTPIDEKLTAKVCQDNSKALMTNPNFALAKWLLRDILRLKEGEILSIQRLEQLGIDSVRIDKNTDEEYSIDIAPFESFERFLNLDTA